MQPVMPSPMLLMLLSKPPTMTPTLLTTARGRLETLVMYGGPRLRVALSACNAQRYTWLVLFLFISLYSMYVIRS